MFYRMIEIGYREITGKRRNNGFGNTTEILRHIAGHAIGEKSSMPDERISFFDQTKSSIHRSGQRGKRNVRSTFTLAGRDDHHSSFFVTIDFLEISRLDPFS